MNIRLQTLVYACLFLSSAFSEAAATNIMVGYCTANLPAAKAAGFAYAEVRIREFVKLSDEEFARFVERSEKSGLPSLTGYWFLPANLKVVGPDVHEDQVTNYFAKAFDRCQRLGVKIIVFGSGDARMAPAGFPKEEAFKQLVALGKQIAPQAQQHGITIVVEPLRQAEDNMINTTAEGLRWVEAVDHPNFQLMVDLYHLTEEGEDPGIIVKAGPHIKHAHISNPHGRVFPLGAEEFDYQPFLTALRQIGYQGVISLEAKTEHLGEQGPRAVEFVRSAFATAGVRP